MISWSLSVKKLVLSMVSGPLEQDFKIQTMPYAIFVRQAGPSVGEDVCALSSFRFFAFRLLRQYHFSAQAQIVTRQILRLFSKLAFVEEI